jgi:cytochrome c556
MRMIGMLLLGLAIGAFGAVTIVSGMKQEVPYARAVMALSAQHFGALRKMHEAGQCDAEPIAAHLRSLRALAEDLEPAFVPTGGDDALFRRHGTEFASRVDAAMLAAPATCDALQDAIGRVGGGCKACHQDFKP